MSFFDTDNMSPEDLVVHFVLECRGSGHFLAANDLQMVVDWLRVAGSPETLLLILADILPNYFAKKKAGATPKSVRSINKKVLQKLREQGMVQADDVSMKVQYCEP